jgi:hypothetical protein
VFVCDASSFNFSQLVSELEETLVGMGAFFLFGFDMFLIVFAFVEF